MDSISYLALQIMGLALVAMGLDSIIWGVL